MKKFLVLFSAFALSTSLIVSGNIPAKADAADNSRYKKDESTVSLKIGKWRDVPFKQGDSFTLNGQRTLWAAQLHVTCSKAPKYIKMRLARHTPNGLDTTGTNTWMLNGKLPNKSWQGSLVWETLSFHPMTVQYKIMGGKGCKSTSREFKYWQLGDSVEALLIPPTG